MKPETTIGPADEAKRSEDVVRTDLDYMVSALKTELDAMAGRSLLITGGAGFLGYYLTQVPLHWNRDADEGRRIRVTVWDSFQRGAPEWLSQLEEEGRLTVEPRDVTAPLADGEREFDYIVHAASVASPQYYRQYPIETMDANVGGLRRLLDYGRARRESGRPLAGFLFFSSSEIYGDPDPDHIPTPETYWGNVSCTGPRACYDESKRYGETLCVNFARVHAIPVKVARPFNNYGPGLKITDGRVIPDFARDILADRDIVMLSDGSPTRTFCYVADAVVGYYKALVLGRAGEAYNIGVDEPEISMAELARRMVALGRELFGYSGDVVHRSADDPDYLVDNPNRRCPVIEKALSELGYAPRIGLHEGLRRSLLWYADNRTAEAG